MSDVGMWNMLLVANLTASQVTSFLASLWAELGKKLGVSLKLGKLRGILGF
jgi:hypothetical protein